MVATRKEVVEAVSSKVIVDEARNGLDGDSFIVDVDGDRLRGITVDIEDAATSMEWGEMEAALLHGVDVACSESKM